MQREVEFEVETTDKSGGFIGVLYLNKTENVAVELVRAGLATVHAFSADNLSWARQLYDAEVSICTLLQATENAMSNFFFVYHIGRSQEGKAPGKTLLHRRMFLLSLDSHV